MKNIKDKIKEIEKVTLIENEEDGTKKYMIEGKKDIDLRKTIFSEIAKENITIF